MDAAGSTRAAQAAVLHCNGSRQGLTAPGSSLEPGCFPPGKSLQWAQSPGSSLGKTGPGWRGFLQIPRFLLFINSQIVHEMVCLFLRSGSSLYSLTILRRCSEYTPSQIIAFPLLKKEDVVRFRTFFLLFSGSSLLLPVLLSLM